MSSSSVQVDIDQLAKETADMDRINATRTVIERVVDWCEDDDEVMDDLRENMEALVAAAQGSTEAGIPVSQTGGTTAASNPSGPNKGNDDVGGLESSNDESTEKRGR